MRVYDHDYFTTAAQRLVIRKYDMFIATCKVTGNCKHIFKLLKAVAIIVDYRCIKFAARMARRFTL